MMPLPRIDDVTVEITNRCQLHCRACGIWREKGIREITPRRFQGLMTDLLSRFRIGSVSITGGEPFCHDGIGGILRHLAGLRARKILHSFGVYTNGAMPGPIAAFFKSHARFLDGMTVGISIDGDEKIHDRLRGKGSFARSRATLELLASRYPGVLLPEVKFTLSTENYATMAGVYDLARSFTASFSPKIVESGVSAYYHRQGTPGAVSLTALTPAMILAVRRQGRDILEKAAHDKGRGVDAVMLRLFLQLLSGRAGHRSCQTPGRCLFITSHGGIYPCLYLPAAGRLKADGRLPAGFNTARADRAQCGMERRCPGCFAYHGYMKRFNVLKDGKTFS